MKTRICCAVCATALVLSVAAAASAQSIKLLAPSVGWMIPARNEVLRTTDGGVHWTNITPSGPKGSVISAIFFLDATRGWILLMRGEPVVQHGLQFDIASTNDGGATWSLVPLKMPDEASKQFFNGGTSLAFADTNHGLLALQSGLTPTPGDYGCVLTTSDGGKTWEQASTGLAGSLSLVTPTFGWLVAGGANDELYVTRDAGKTWRRVVLEAPIRTPLMQHFDRNQARFRESFRRNLSPAAAAYAKKLQQPTDRTYAAYSLPVFKEPKHGYISVTYPDLVVLFQTEDAGVTWKPDKVITGLHGHQAGARVASALADSTWITGKAANKGLPEISLLGPTDHAATIEMPAPEESGIRQMSFITPREGWALTVNHLLATEDGGATWRDVTPH